MDGTVRVPLRCGEIAIVDKADSALVSDFRWHATKRGKQHGRTPYAAACLGNRQAQKWGVRHIRMHRLILNFPDSQIDHINGNGLDNRRCNLRLCTATENQINTLKSRRKSSSRYKGVSWHKKSKRWQVFLSIDKCNKYIGEFDSEIDAALAYDEAATETYGEFARANFPLLSQVAPA